MDSRNHGRNSVPSQCQKSARNKPENASRICFPRPANDSVTPASCTMAKRLTTTAAVIVTPAITAVCARFRVAFSALSGAFISPSLLFSAMLLFAMLFSSMPFSALLFSALLFSALPFSVRSARPRRTKSDFTRRKRLAHGSQNILTAASSGNSTPVRPAASIPVLA